MKTIVATLAEALVVWAIMLFTLIGFGLLSLVVGVSLPSMILAGTEKEIEPCGHRTYRALRLVKLRGLRRVR
jgi:hypothetical protein